MLKKANFLVILTFILGDFSIAQNTNFNLAFPIISGTGANSYSVMNGIDNSVIVYGVTVDSNYQQDLAISKIDSNGNVLWRKYYHRTGFDFIPFAAANELGVNVPWGGEIGEIDWYNDTSSVLAYWGLYHFDGNGDTIWTKNYQDSTLALTDQVKTTQDKKFLVYGIWENNSDRYQGFGTLFLRKTDSLGNIIWTRTYHDTDSRSREPSGIDTCKDGGYILCAYDRDTNTNYAKLFCWDGKIMVMKTDSLGNIQWTKYIPNVICDTRAFSIRTLKTGGYIVCGYWDDSLNWSGEIAFGYMYMAKLNDSGNMVWSKIYGLHNEEGENVLSNLREMPNGDVVASGYGDTLGKPLLGAILRTDSNGNQKWLRYYYKFHPEDVDNLTDIQLTSDGGLIASGTTWSSPEDFWVVKTDSLGCDTVGCNFATGIKQTNENEEGVRVFPNPSNGNFIISLQNINNKCTAEIYNMLGESIYKATLNSGNTEINLSGQPEGIYFYRVLSESGKLVGEGKLVIEK